MSDPNPFANAVSAPTPPTALAQSDAQRSIAEVQAALMIARMNPRDPKRAMDLILQDCTRPGLAEKAVYAYARGGQDITGPSIRIAEAVAQRWGNIQYGIRELEQRDGESVVQAYAWDVETNTRREVTFTVVHVRDTKRGRVRLKDARDVYEMTANQGMRRVRACLLGVIPGDVIEAAVAQCEVTNAAKAKVTPERLAQMLEVFASFGVSKEAVEKRIQRRIEAMTPALMLQLGKIANSLRDGMSSPADWFEGAAAPSGAAGVSPVRRAAPSATPDTPGASPAETGSAGEAFVSALGSEPAAPPPDGAMFDPAEPHLIKSIEPATTRGGKAYHLIALVGGGVAHTWSAGVAEQAQAALRDGVPVRLTARPADFPRAPWRVDALTRVEAEAQR